MPAKVYGVDDVVAAMSDLRSEATILAISRRATIGPAKDLVAMIKSQALVFRVMNTGATHRNIAQKRMRSGSLIGYTVGVRHGTKKQIRATMGWKKGEQGAQNDDPWYWFMVEFGTRKMAARPFFRTAWSRFKAGAETTIVSRAMSEVYRAANRAKRAAAKKGTIA